MLCAGLLVLLIRRYPELQCLSFFVQASGEHVSIVNTFNLHLTRRTENKALPKFYAISGCDKTGCLNSKGKMSY